MAIRYATRRLPHGDTASDGGLRLCDVVTLYCIPDAALPSVIQSLANDNQPYAARIRATFLVSDALLCWPGRVEQGGKASGEEGGKETCQPSCGADGFGSSDG